MRRFRRGQQEIQFNWIFALIGGALFLIFFFILIRSITTSHEDTNVRQLSFAVETILTRAASTPEMFSKVELQNEEYRIACERDAASFSSYVRIGENDYDPFGLRYVPVFSPSSIRGDELFILTRTWEAPFPIGSLLLVSNNRTRYVFVGTPSKTRAFAESENLGAFNIVHVGRDAVSGVRDDGFDNYRFVFFNNNPIPIPNDLGKKSTALLITSDNPGFERGKVKFYRWTASGWQQTSSSEFSYYGTAMLDAAIFSDDAAKFSCNMVKATERLKTTILILKSRLSQLKYLSQQTTPTVPSICAAPYTTAMTQLDSYITNPSSAFTDAKDGEGPIIELERLNQQANANDCPSIY